MKAVVFPKIVKGLKPGGVFLLEAYTPEQLEYGTGGGKDADAMMTQAVLSHALHGFSFDWLQEVEREVVEGAYHTGLASVVQAIAVKPTI